MYVRVFLVASRTLLEVVMFGTPEFMLMETLEILLAPPKKKAEKPLVKKKKPIVTTRKRGWPWPA